MDKKTPVTIFWFRRDLRLHDNAGLYRALKGPNPVLCLFIFDREILDKLEDRDDARVTFIYNTITKLSEELAELNSSLLIKYDKPINAWNEVLSAYEVAAVCTNRDYEPYAKKRDGELAELFVKKDIKFKLFKDQVILHRNEVVKDDQLPYTVFTPYKNRWLRTVNAFYMKAYPPKNVYIFYNHNNSGHFQSTDINGAPAGYQVEIIIGSTAKHVSPTINVYQYHNSHGDYYYSLSSTPPNSTYVSDGIAYETNY